MKDNPRHHTSRPSILSRSIAFSLLACLTIATVEWARAVMFPHAESQDLAGVLLLLFLMISAAVIVGTLCGGAQAAYLYIARLLADSVLKGRISARRQSPTRAFAAALLLSPCVAWFANSLFSGRRASLIPHRDAIVVGLSMAACLAAFFLFWWVQKIFRALTERKLGIGSRAALGCSLALLSALLYCADAFLYTGLYPHVHAALGLAMFLVVEALWLLAFPSRRPMRLRTAAALAGAAVLSLLSFSRIPGAAAVRNRSRYTILTRTTISARLLRLPGLLRRHPARSLAGGLADVAPFWTRNPAMKALVNAPRPFGRARNMNILLVTIDAMRADHLGCYGYPRNTSPHLDALAAKGTRFENAYVPVPYSFFSLLGLLTSRYGSSFILGTDVNAPHTLADILREAGYRTGAFFPKLVFFGQNPDNPLRRVDLGFEHFQAVPHKQENADAIFGLASRFIARAGTRPFFLWVHFLEPHYPFESHDGFDFGDKEADLYDGEIAYIDSFIGRLVDLLKKRGLEEQTVIAVTADHGEGLGEHGHSYHGTNLYDEQTRVIMLLRVPGLGKRVIPQPVQTLDLAPTFLSLIGLPPQHGQQGSDLSPLLVTEKEICQGAAFSEVVRGRIEKRMVRVGKWKLIRDLASGVEELYDLESDPAEKHNVYGQDVTPGPELTALLDDWSAHQYASNGQPGASSVGPPSELGLLVAYTRAGDTASLEKLLLQLDESLSRGDLIEIIGVVGSLEKPPSGDAVSGRLREKARERVHPFLQHKDPAVRREASLTLARLGDCRAVSFLIEHLRADDEVLRLEAARYLGTLGDRNAVAPLIRYLDSAKKESERRESALSLAHLQNAHGLVGLHELLGRGIKGIDKQEVHSAIEVVRALGALGDTRSFEPLRATLLSEGWYRNSWYGYEIIRALERIGDIRALHVLEEILKTSNFEPCRKAAENAANGLKKTQARR